MSSACRLLKLHVGYEVHDGMDRWMLVWQLAVGANPANALIYLTENGGFEDVIEARVVVLIRDKAVLALG